MIRMAAILAASLVFIAFAQTADQPKETPQALERKLHGSWKGPACGGEWTFAPDGTYEVQHYSPGNNKLTGTWRVRWDALPPTLIRTCKTSDAPDRITVGEKTEVKLVQLDDEALAWQFQSERPQRYTRVKK